MPRFRGGLRTSAAALLSVSVVALAFVGVDATARASSVASSQASSVASSTAARPVLHFGMTSPYVKVLQIELQVAPVSGYFGPITKAAVVRLQRASRLPVTGVVDARTWAAAHRSAAAKSSARVVVKPASFIARGRVVLRVAARYAGVRYVAGGTTPRSGFDCSGYTRYVYSRLGISLPHQSRLQYARTHHITRARAVPGDLVFYYDGGRIHHVAIYAGSNTVWHSPRPGDHVRRERIWTTKILFGRV